jgi:trigger factor
VKNAVESLEPTKVKLTVEVEPEDLGAALSRAYREIAGRIRVPGFRPGKAPRQIIDNRVGRGAVVAQAVEDGLSGWFVGAVREQKVNPMGQPEIDITESPDAASPEPSLEFTAVFEVPPQITIPDLTKVKVTVESADVTDADVDEAIDSLRERFSSLKTVDRPAREGDFVTIDLKAEVGEEEVDSVSGVSHQVGAGNLLDGLEEALDGLSAGETTTFESPLQGGVHAGETALVTVTVTAVKERELPEADDEFAEMVSSFDTIDELREDARGDLARTKTRFQVLQAQDKLIEHLLETLDFPAPPGVVATETQKVLDRAAVDPDQEFEVEGEEVEGAEARKEKAAEEATQAIRTQLLMDALAEQLGAGASQDELAEFMISTASSYGIDPGQFIQAAQKNGELPHFYAELVRHKAALAAVARITVEDAEGQAVDVSALVAPAPPAGEAPEAQSGAVPPAAESPADPLVDEVVIDIDALTEPADQTD